MYSFIICQYGRLFISDFINDQYAAWQTPTGSTGIAHLYSPILARRRQAGERGEDERESSYVQVGMII